MMPPFERPAFDMINQQIKHLKQLLYNCGVITKKRKDMLNLLRDELRSEVKED